MGYKGAPFFSTEMYRELLKPFHKKAVDWAHERGMVTELHSCGFIEPLLDDVVDTGVEMLNPLEVKAGMDPFHALQAITINPAKHIGIEDRVGSLEVGKDADIVIARGCPLHVHIRPCAVLVNGEVVYSAE